MLIQATTWLTDLTSVDNAVQSRDAAGATTTVVFDGAHRSWRQVTPRGTAEDAAGEHQHRLGQDLAAVMDRGPLTGRRDLRGERVTQPQAVRERAERVEADMGDDLVAAPFHHHRNRAVTVHLASALPGQVFRRVDNVRIACHEGTSADARPSINQNP